MSAQVPLLINAEVRNPDNEEKKGEMIKVMFKFGDDLRQDNLVLQFFRIMDEMWMQQSMNMEMVRYQVLETGNKVGYIEFVLDSEVIATMHKWRGIIKGSFAEKSIYEYFKQEIYPLHFKENLMKVQNEGKTAVELEEGGEEKLGKRRGKQFKLDHS
jgi:phosphatidylinositol kinase/protein kinase (PI-3  family)